MRARASDMEQLYAFWRAPWPFKFVAFLSQPSSSRIMQMSVRPRPAANVSGVVPPWFHRMSMDGMFSVPAPYSGNSSGNGAGAGAGAGNGNTPAGLQFKPPSIDTSMISMGANGAGTCDTSGDAWRLPSALSLSL